jgi:phosphate transport system ATP-binding protein
MAEPALHEPSAATAKPPERTQAARGRVETDKLTAMYGKFTAVKGVSLAFPTRRVHALIGPSGCGKSTFLRTINRMHELSEQGWITGRVLLDGEDIYAPVNAMQLRRRVGMVFSGHRSRPCDYDNAAGPGSTAGCRAELTRSWSARSARPRLGQVKDGPRQRESASGGQQRLCWPTPSRPAPTSYC